MTRTNAFSLPDKPRPVLQAGRISIDPERYEVCVDGEAVRLTLSEFQILSIMARRPGCVFTPQHIVTTLESRGLTVVTTGLKNHIWMLRRKLGPASSQLKAARGVGYYLTRSSD